MLVLLHQLDYEAGGNSGATEMNLLVATQLLRLLRIPRISDLLRTSLAFQSWWEKQNVPRYAKCTNFTRLFQKDLSMWSRLSSIVIVVHFDITGLCFVPSCSNLWQYHTGWRACGRSLLFVRVGVLEMGFKRKRIGSPTGMILIM